VHIERAGGAYHPAPVVTTAILVVDDELLIRMMLTEHLIRQGYKVLEAASGDEAVEVVASGVRIDVVLSDVRMPGKRDGLGLLEFVRAHRPDLPTILCSGTLTAETAVARGAADFVPKPFTLPQIEATLKKVLDLAAPSVENAPSCVLLVDSDVAVRLVLAEYLRECGHEVIEAADTDEGLVALTQSDRDIDIILCSITSAGSLNGFELARWVRTNKPELEVALAGSVEAAAGAAADICDDGPKLKRPYEPERVVDYIKRLRAARDQHPGSKRV
jgi:DNA-binding NtrC family response regulator